MLRMRSAWFGCAQLHELTGAQKFEENVSLRAIANMLKKGTLTGMNQNKMLKRVGG